jgi:uncharacterized membrane protein SpoIIM required for sporulation
MSEIDFESRHGPEWDELASALPTGKKAKAAAKIPAAEVPRRFRRAVAELALARDRQYRTSLIDRLHSLVISAHLVVHGARAERGHGMLAALRKFIFETLPVTVRKESPFVLAAGATFFGTMLGVLAAILWHPDFVYYLLSPETLSRVQSMYAPGNDRFGAGREADGDLMMFGFYISNNVQIDLQVLAGGIFFGLGSLFFIIYNALHIGAIAGHLTQVGYGENFWGFVAGHSAFELTGLVLAGAAGLRIGHALVAPGRRSRGAALHAAGRPAAVLVYGAAMLTTAAAVIEAFWSSRVSLPLEVKIAFGVAMAVVTVVYFTFAGRTRGS